MTDRVMTDRVRAEALGMGMDLVGFGPVSRWEHAPRLMSPAAILPESRTVVVCGLHITDTWTEMGGEPEPQDRSPGGWMDQNSLLDRAAYRLARTLQESGYAAIPVASSNIWRYRKFEGIPSEFAPDLSHIHAAAAAGLAEIGWSGLAITPEFGARCRFISIVTSAELVPTPMYAGPPLCDLCGACFRACPTAALRKELGPPHEVRIGARTFRYANKNMWRCAWGEHFDLDLNSDHLKAWPEIGEAEILREIRERGKRGHERGVCQKVCVPPHLRTDQPSFGRADKHIAQNRIARRYPETMPTLRKMRDDLLAAAVQWGADVTAVAPLRGDVATVPGYSVLRELPGARTILAFGMRFAPDLRPVPAFTWVSLQIHHIGLRLARMVEDFGYHAAFYNWAHDLGEMAGLGRRGHGEFRELELPEFGRDAIVGAVVTDAPLDPTPEPASPPACPPRPAAPAPAALRRRLEALADQNLATLFGVAPAERFDPVLNILRERLPLDELGESVVDANPQYHGPFQPEIRREPARLRAPADHLPGARSVIVLGMPFPPELIGNAGLPETQQIGPYAFWQYQTHRELGFAACALALELSGLGFRATVVEDLLGLGSRVDSHRGLLPDARCNALEAVAAGLGSLGASGALLTPEHGPHQRVITVVTDAVLPPSSVYQGPDLCLRCGACRADCPMQAFEPESDIVIQVDGTEVRVPGLRRHRCDWSKRYALCPEEGPALIGNKTDVARPEGRITIEMIAGGCARRDPVMKRRPCILETCLRVCRAPAGA
jgi:epoxyqueuosine reductase QueG